MVRGGLSSRSRRGWRCPVSGQAASAKRVSDSDPYWIENALEDYSPPKAKCLFGRPHRYGTTYVDPKVFACTSCDAVLDQRDGGS